MDFYQLHGGRMRHLFIPILSLILSSNCLARGGSWSGGGGSGIVWQKNPWSSNQQLNYCIEDIDPVSFSLDAKEVEDALVEAVSTWSKFLNSMEPQTLNFYAVVPAKRPCSDPLINIRVKAGYTDQSIAAVRSLMPNPISFANPSDYDFASQSVKGTFWFAPDRGKNIYSLAKPEQENFWKNAELFKAAMRHEVGHAMGFDHTISGMMHEDYPKNKFLGSSEEADPEYYRFYNWLGQAGKYCGAFEAHNPADFGRALQLVDSDGIKSVCITPTSANSQFPKMSLSFRGINGEILFSMLLSYRQAGKRPFGYDDPAWFSLSMRQPKGMDDAFPSTRSVLSFGTPRIEALNLGEEYKYVSIETFHDALLFELRDAKANKIWFRIKEPRAK